MKNYRGISCAALLALGLLLSACGGGKQDDNGLPVANAAPVANAGTSQTVAMAATVTLDGSSSSDANGDTLTYKWTLTSVPSGSTAVLSSATAQKPTFVADKLGSYVVTLVVNDGQSNSSNLASATITAEYPTTGYTKLDANGLPLNDNATSWSCVRDNANKLIWEVKNMTDPANLRYYRNGYSNYDSTTEAQVYLNSTPLTQTQLEASTNSIGYKKAVNTQGLCGANDWRVPDINELKGLQFGSSAPFINTNYFPDLDLTHTCNYACYGMYWSSSPDAVYSWAAQDYYFDAYYNGANHDGRGNSYSLRLVRSVQ